MIRLGAEVVVSLADHRTFRSIASRTWRLTSHKSLEVQASYYTGMFNVVVEWTGPGDQDHHGLLLEVAILGLTLTINLYDHRHTEDFK